MSKRACPRICRSDGLQGDEGAEELFESSCPRTDRSQSRGNWTSPEHPVPLLALALEQPKRGTPEEGRVQLTARGLTRFKLPERLEVFDALPRNPLGKVQRNLLRDAVEARGTDGESS